MQKKTSSLLFKFAVIFGAFTLVTLIMSGVATYVNQMESYQKQCETKVRSIGEFLAEMMIADGDNFVRYQEYYMSHYEEMEIPYDFDEYQTAWEKYQRLLRKEASSKGYKEGEDIPFDDLSPKVKEAYFIYFHEFWLLTFEKARKAFDLPYTYYLVPREEIYHMVYMIDGERTVKEGSDGKLLYLGDEYYDDPDVYTVQWDTWFTGQKQDGFQVWNNEWGHTYAYYTPLIINGKKLGLIGTEMEVASVNQEILKNTLIQIITIGIILIVCVIAVLSLISNRYIYKIVQLSANVKRYSKEKDSSLAGEIEKSATGNNEITTLTRQIATMIKEIENYLTSLFETKKELSETKEHVSQMKAMANRDSLTLVRNKAAYDEEVQKLNRSMEGEAGKYGFAMVDLNYLKRINDTFGHEQGNVAIRKVCRLVCETFKHSPVFRIGGDEFIVILKNEDYENAAELEKNFYLKMEEWAKDEELPFWEKISAAMGIAFYSPEIDENAESVFRRADKAMYQKKKAMKAALDE